MGYILMWMINVMTDTCVDEYTALKWMCFECYSYKYTYCFQLYLITHYYYFMHHFWKMTINLVYWLYIVSNIMNKGNTYGNNYIKWPSQIVSTILTCISTSTIMSLVIINNLSCYHICESDLFFSTCTNQLSALTLMRHHWCVKHKSLLYPSVLFRQCCIDLWDMMS